jgi:N utilization substance protein B
MSQTRHTARERAMGLLYEAEQKNQPVSEILTELPTEPDPFAVDLATGADERRDAIDQMLGRYAKGWAVDRMPATDRAILRMAVYELEERPDVPTGAIISEAVALAGEFSTDESSRFVNGLLARIAQEVRPAESGGA